MSCSRSPLGACEIFLNLQTMKNAKSRSDPRGPRLLPARDLTHDQFTEEAGAFPEPVRPVRRW